MSSSCATSPFGASRSRTDPSALSIAAGSSTGASNIAEISVSRPK
jgi:hypothetical protein